MLFGRNKNESNARPTPQWFKFVILAFLAYAFGHYMLTQRNRPEAAPPLETAKKAEETFAEFTQAVFPSIGSGVSVTDETVGEGAEAYCGQRVTLRAKSSLRDGTVIDEPAEAVIRLGSREAVPAIDRNIEGMKVGGRRVIFAPNTELYEAPGFERAQAQQPTIPKDSTVKIDVELLAAEPPVPQTSLPLHALTVRADDAMVRQGRPAKCGQAIRVRWSGWNAEGQPFVTQDTREILLGGDWPLGLLYGLTGINVNEMRALVLPQEWMLPVTKDMAADTVGNAANTAPTESPPLPVAWPQKGVVILNVERLPDAAETNARK